MTPRRQPFRIKASVTRDRQPFRIKAAHREGGRTLKWRRVHSDWTEGEDVEAAPRATFLPINKNVRLGMLRSGALNRLSTRKRVKDDEPSTLFF